MTRKRLWAAVLHLVAMTLAGCAPDDPQRAAVEWVLETEGRVRVVVGQETRELAGGRLPSKPFVVHAIAWEIYPGDRNTRVTDADLQRLAPLTELRELDLWAAPITDAGVAAIVRMSRLERLQLSQTEITDVGLQELAALQNLRQLGIADTQVTRRGIREFQRRRPDCKVVFSVPIERW